MLGAGTDIGTVDPLTLVATTTLDASRVVKILKPIDVAVDMNDVSAATELDSDSIPLA